jgi:hypothetical protein
MSYRLEAFFSLTKHSSNELIADLIKKMIDEIDGESPYELKDIFKIWLYKRHVREGDKEKLLSYKYFLELYELFPNTCIKMVNLFKEIGYWKDIYLIWEIINNMKISNEDRYNRYNALIESFRECILIQRKKDLRILQSHIYPNNLVDLDNNMLRDILKSKADITISYVGKYCIREKSKLNKTLYWFIKDENNILLKQSHVSYMIRGSLKLKLKSSYDVCDYPINKSVPLKTKKTYRELNAKLNVVLNSPEILMCSKKFNLIEPSELPYTFKKKNLLALMNENNNKDSLTQERINLRNRMVGYIHNNEHIDSKTIMIETNEDIFNNAMNKNIYNDLEVILQKSNEKI